MGEYSAGVGTGIGVNQSERAVQSAEDINSVEDFTLWAARALGEATPTIAAIVTGGGAGILLGRLIAKRLIKRSTAVKIAKTIPTIASTGDQVLKEISKGERDLTLTDFVKREGEGISKEVLAIADKLNPRELDAFRAGKFGRTGVGGANLDQTIQSRLDYLEEQATFMSDDEEFTGIAREYEDLKALGEEMGFNSLIDSETGQVVLPEVRLLKLMNEHPVNRPVRPGSTPTPKPKQLENDRK